MIESYEISVVVQGAVNFKETPKTLKSIRKYLPDAEIILSTWEGTDVSGLDFDVLVLSKDPGNALIESFKNKVVYNNMNRQLLSTKNGLEKAERKYTLKLRSDLILSQNSFLEYFDKFQKRVDNYCLFERKVLTSTLFSRYNIKFSKAQERVLIPFHISDWWFFGLTDDVKKYFMDTELVLEPDFTSYFAKPENMNKKTPYPTAKFKFAPEQYFGYECFSRNFPDIRMEDAADSNDEINRKSQICIVNNFIILEHKQSGIYLNKYTYSKNEKFAGDQYIGLYNFYRYESEYKKYCDSEYDITADKKLFENEKLGYSKLRIYKHLFKLTDPATPIVEKFEQFFFGVPFSSLKYLIDKGRFLWGTKM